MPKNSLVDQMVSEMGANISNG